MKTSIINFVSAIGILNISILFKGLSDAFGTDSSWISQEGGEILNNPLDKEEVEKAISDLKKGNPGESKEVKLSNGKVINIRID